MIKEKRILKRVDLKPIIIDYAIPSDQSFKKMIVFCHGFKGFKDWGSWNLVQKHFVDNGFGFLKFNFSHNGGTMEDPIDFPDLESFGNNNYSKEQVDLKNVIEFVFDKWKVKSHLVGHSRGGGAVLLQAKNKKVESVVTWAGVSNLISRVSEVQISEWNSKGVFFINNARTNQEMPMYQQFYEDLILNKKELDIEPHARVLEKPVCIIHGENDNVVNVSEAKELHTWISNSQIHVVKGAGHTFETKHPWEGVHFPKAMKEVLLKSIEFFNSID